MLEMMFMILIHDLRIAIIDLCYWSSCLKETDHVMSVPRITIHYNPLNAFVISQNNN